MSRLIRSLITLATSLSAVAALAQNTVFNASFSGDALNPASYPTVTSSTTGWTVASNKSSPAPTEAGGVLTINMAGTSSGFVEAQALVAASPVRLLPGTFLDVAATFIPTFVDTNASDNLMFGLFNSGGTPPVTGLLNSGLSSGSTTFANGGAKGWIGFNANLPQAGSPRMLTRAAQTATNNTVQDVLIDSQSTSTGYTSPAGVSASSVGSLAATLTNGNPYTLEYRLSLSADGATLTALVNLYNGAGTSGTGGNTLIGSYSGRFTGTSLLTTAFDAFAIGWRADAGTSNPSNLKLSGLLVTTTGGAPWVVTQPPSSLLASIGSTITIPAEMGGQVATYQWQVNTDGSTWTNLDSTANPSATTATLSLANVQNSTAGAYRLVATNAAGSTTSSACVVSVASGTVAPSISVNPVGATLMAGANYSFSVTANGTAPLTYQWFSSPDGVTYSPISGATDATFDLTNITLLNEGYYRVTVTNSAGSATSTPAQLVVNQPLAINQQPAGATLNVGDSYTLTVQALGKPAPTYQWYLNGTAIGGATGSSYTITSAGGANAGIYTVVASNTAGDQVTSNGAAVAVLSPSLTATAFSPSSHGSNVHPDAHLTVTFSQPVSIGVMGQIRIYDTANPSTPVDTIDLVAANALMKTLRTGAPLSTLALPVQTKTVGGLTNLHYYPLTVSGNTVSIYPRNNTLKYGKTYYVAIDPGVFTDASGLSFAGLSDATGWSFSTEVSGPAATATWLTVAADGSGDFASVQGALDSLPAGNTTPRTIYLRKGTYFEQVYFTGKHAITFLGEDRSQSIIAYPNNNNFNNVGGTYHRMVFQADHANNVSLVNLTVQNTTPQNGSQAEAVVLNGGSSSKGILSNVDLVSYQDTLLINGQGYIANSHITGDVDFMWGNGPNFFENCEITGLRSNAYFTQIRNGATTHGNVYLNCTLDAPAGIVGMYLGRIDPTSGGFPYSEVVWLNCVMGAANGGSYSTPVNAAGWLLNNTADQSAASAPNVHFWEYNSHYSDGTPLDVSGRIGASRQLTLANDATTIANYSTPSYILGGWTPQLAPVIAVQPTAQTVNAGAGVTLSVKAFGVPAVTYQWQRNGTAITGATDATYTVPSSTGADAGTYSVVVSNGVSSVTSATVPLVVHGGPPVVVLPPANTTALLGTTATLNVWALGDSPLSYQWSKDGTPLAGATRASLRLTGLQPTDAGSYTVAITNAGGTTVSSAASLTLATPATTLPPQPVIPAAVFDVTSYGVVGDGATDNTTALQAAINAASAAGGGTVELPPATAAYLTGPITIPSNIDLQVDAGAVLQALPFGTYPRSLTSPSHFITIVSGSSNVEFSGGGVIDGNGADWWAAFNAGTISGRPRLVQITKLSTALFSGVTFQNSPNFHLAFSGLNNNVTIFGVTISSPGDSPNTDGMDIAGTNFLIQHCSVSDGDDNIVAKPGSVFCRNLYIADCAFGAGHGLSVGGQTNVGLDGMVVTNCTFNGTSVGLRLKADPTQGGPVQNITYSNITMTNVTYPILFYSYYNQLGSPGATSGSSQITPAKVNTWNVTPPNSLAASTIPGWKNITVSNLTATGSTGYSTIWGVPLASGLVSTVTLDNVKLSGAGLELYDATNIQVTGNSTVGPIVTCNALGISKQPQSATVNVGDSVTFTATVVGASGLNNTAPTYQWSFNGTPLADGTQPDGSVVAGATTTTLTISNARATGGGNYTLTASNQLDGYDVASSSLVPNSLPVSATSSAAVLTVKPLPATVTLANLAQTYDGTAKAPTATTSPAGLPVTFAFGGGATPINAGSYAVTATISDPNYTGSASGTLVISPATPVLTWNAPAAITYGTPLDATQLNAAASTAGTFTYTPAPGTVLNAGAAQPLTVVFTPADSTNYTGASAATTITVNPAPVTIALSNLAQVYNGTPRPVGVTTSPDGVAVAVAYGGGPMAPTAAGSYAVTATAADPNYTGSASGTLVVAKATPVITWPKPAAITYGTALSATQLNATASVPGSLSYSPAAGTVLNAGPSQALTALFSPTDSANYTGATASTTIDVKKASGVITLTGLSQPYDGTAKSVQASTVPTGLNVTITYNGSTSAPVFPGQYLVAATVDDPNYAATLNQTMTITITALVRHAPTLNGGVDGSVQVLSGENVTLNGGAWLSGDLLVPGTPSLRLNGLPTIAGSYDADGSASPSNYSVTLNGKSVIRYLVRRIDPITVPAVNPPPAPRGTRTVTVNSPSDPIGDFATIRDLTLNGNAGTVTLPPGTYGNVVANGRTVLVLGDAGASEPEIYNLQSLTLNGSSSIRIAGPVLLVLANGVTLNGNVGDTGHAEWLTLAVAQGGVTLNGNVSLAAYVIAPSGAVTINGGATLTGEVTADRLTVNGNGQLQEPAP